MTTKIFISEDYLLKSELVYEVHPYGIGIVIDQRDLAEAIENRRIADNVVSDNNIRVVHYEKP